METMNGNQKFGILTASLRIAVAFMFAGLFTLQTFGQTAGTATLRGRVILGESGRPVHNALITILQLKRTVDTDNNGNYEFQGVPPGKYDIVAHLDRVPDIVRTVDLTTGDGTVNFQIELTGVREEVTVTATGAEQAVSS